MRIAALLTVDHLYCLARLCVIVFVSNVVRMCRFSLCERMQKVMNNQVDALLWAIKRFVVSQFVLQYSMIHVLVLHMLWQLWR